MFIHYSTVKYWYSKQTYPDLSSFFSSCQTNFLHMTVTVADLLACVYMWFRLLSRKQNFFIFRVAAGYRSGSKTFICWCGFFFVFVFTVARGKLEDGADDTKARVRWWERTDVSVWVELWTSPNHQHSQALGHNWFRQSLYIVCRCSK